MEIRNETGITFDDVLLEPRKSTVSSRFDGNIDFSSKILPDISLPYPIVSANMDTVTEIEMAEAMRQFGGLGIIHRFMKIEKHGRQILALKGPKVGCVGVGKDGRERALALKSACDAILVDIAHGHCDAMIKQISWLKREIGLPIIAGNVATPEGALELANAGADCIKIGVGPGSLCTTRIKTGAGVPQLTAIMNARKALDWVYFNRKAGSWNPTIIADGGIRCSGDIIKAFAAGASAVMVGRLFAGTDEAPGDVINISGKGKIKVYRGMASKEAQESWKGKATSVEGEMTWVSYKGRVEDVFNELLSGMLSGMSYQNAHNLVELSKNAVFIRQTPAGYMEAQPHALKK